MFWQQSFEEEDAMRSLLKLGGYCNLVISLLHIMGLFWAKEFFRVTGVAEPMN